MTDANKLRAYVRTERDINEAVGEVEEGCMFTWLLAIADRLERQDKWLKRMATFLGPIIASECQCFTDETMVVGWCCACTAERLLGDAPKETT